MERHARFSWLGTLLAVALLPAGRARAQAPGDAVVLGQYVNPLAMALVTVPAAGSPAPIPLHSDGRLASAAGLVPAPFNDGVVFTAREQVGSGRFLLLHYRRGSLDTLARMATPLHYVPDIRVDQNSDLLLLNQTGQPATSGIFRIPFGGPALSTLATGIWMPVAMEEDLRTGRWIVSTANGDVYAVSRDGRITSVLSVLPIRRPVIANQHVDFVDGSLLFAGGTSIVRMDTRYFTTTTLLVAGPSGPVFVGLDFDPLHGDFYRVDAAALHRYDPSTGRANTLVRFGGFVPTDVAVWGGRMLTGRGRAAPGADYWIEVSMPTETARSYVAAASFGALFGILTPAGRIPLDPDPLFYLSLFAPTVFRDFSGTLGLAGRTRLTVRTPNAAALRGLRFFVAVVSYDRNGIRVITEPLGITVE